MLCGLGVARAERERTVRMFRAYDEALLKRQHAIYPRLDRPQESTHQITFAEYNPNKR